MTYLNTFSYKYFKKSKFFSSKHKNYFQIYDTLFSKYRNKKITFVEIGIFSGGSLFMWRNFFGKKAKIIGIELNPEAKKFEKYNFKIEIGSQSSEEFWKKFFSKYGKVDIVLDDGGHTNYQQIIDSWEPYYPTLNIINGSLQKKSFKEKKSLFGLGLF